MATLSEANDVVGVPGLTSEAHHKLLDVTQLLAWFVICVETAPQQTTGRTRKALPDVQRAWHVRK